MNADIKKRAKQLALHCHIEDEPDYDELLDCLFTTAGQQVVLEVYRTSSETATNYVFTLWLMNSPTDYVTVGEEVSVTKRMTMITREVFDTFDAALNQHDRYRDQVVRAAYGE